LKGRKRIIVKLARFFQKLAIVLAPIESLVIKIFNLKATSSLSAICLLSCPRGGSTLTYQMLATSIKGTYLSNFDNLLYATPYLSFWFSDFFKKRRLSSFHSNYGFVNGVFGEAEGLRFWQHWTGQDLLETRVWKPEKAKELFSRLNISVRNDQYLITGYLGHVFCIEDLRELVDDIKFVYLRRNLIDNAISVLRACDHSVFSSSPDITYSKQPVTRVAQQLLAIHYKIFQSRDDDYILIDFEDIVDDPVRSIKKLLNSINEGFAVSDKFGHLASFENLSSTGIEKYSRSEIKAELINELGSYNDVRFNESMFKLLD